MDHHRPWNLMLVLSLSFLAFVPVSAQQAGTSGQMTAGDPTTQQQNPPSTTAFAKPPPDGPVWTIYLKTKFNQGSIVTDRLVVHSDGRVFNSSGKYLGQLTDGTGNTFERIPERRNFEIRTDSGQIIGSTQGGTGQTHTVHLVRE